MSSSPSVEHNCTIQVSDDHLCRSYNVLTNVRISHSLKLVLFLFSFIFLLCKKAAFINITCSIFCISIPDLWVNATSSCFIFLIWHFMLYFLNISILQYLWQNIACAITSFRFLIYNSWFHYNFLSISFCKFQSITGIAY